MCKWYKEMDCFLLTQTTQKQKHTLDKIAQRAMLEQSFRNYAAVFDKVKLVISESQAKEHFLNFPFVSHSKNSSDEFDLLPLLKNANSEAVFIGHTNLVDFPISILVELIKSYNNEMFLGYKSPSTSSQKLNFGIYNKSIIPTLEKTASPQIRKVADTRRFKFLSVPEAVQAVFL